jgi:lysophospholipase L1-like esterase
MQKRTHDAYEQGGRENDALVVYAGDRMHEAYRRGEEMYAEDGSHPSPAASRIIAEAFADALL